MLRKPSRYGRDNKAAAAKTPTDRNVARKISNDEIITTVEIGAWFSAANSETCPNEIRNPAYVGRSKNLRKRAKTHEIRKQIAEKGFHPYIVFKHCDNSEELEARLIKRLNPFLNIKGRDLWR